MGLTPTKHVLGLDLSLTSTGMAMIEGGKLVGVDSVKTKGKRADTIEDRAKRLRHIADVIVEFVRADQTDLIVIEAPSYGSRFGSAHDRSGLWWIVTEALITAGFQVALVAPQTRAKYATGAGNSKKDIVLAHVIERYVSETTPRISNDDEADAVALAAMGARFLGEPVEDELPEANLAAMSGAQWPTS